MEYDITINDVLKLANVKGQTVDYWRDTNKIHSIKKNGSWLYNKENIEAYLNKRRNDKKSIIQRKEEHLSKGIICPICQEKTKYTGIKAFYRDHFYVIHKDIDQKKYYDDNILKDIDKRYCPTCHVEKKFLDVFKGYRLLCSDPFCRMGCDEVIGKIQDTKFKRYGDKFYVNKEKAKETCLKMYGDPNYTNREKSAETWANKPEEEKEEYRRLAMLAKSEKYCKEISEQLKQYNCSLVSHVSESVDIKCHICNNISTLDTKLIGNRIIRKIQPCLHCHPLQSPISSAEKEIGKFVEENYKGKIEWNDRKEIQTEIDILLPEVKIGIEYNGAYWHSSKYKLYDYHKNKSEKCQEMGIRLLHIFEDEWTHKKEIIKDKILNILGKTSHRIFARKCRVEIVSDVKKQKEFYNINHIQGWTASKISIGLYYNDELSALMSFASPRTNKTVEYELVRYATKLNHVVVGGASKIFSFFIENYNPSSIVSYADNAWSSGNLYDKLGFVRDGISSPSYFYIDKKTLTRYHRFYFNKNRLKKMGFLDKNETEEQAMIRLDKYHKIFDCGKIRYIWRK